MKYRTVTLKSCTQATIETEIVFSVASVRAEGYELLRLDFAEENERLKPFSEKVLRALKRNGRIQLFLCSENAAALTDEARYMRNKYPDFVNSVNGVEKSLLVKL